MQANNGDNGNDGERDWAIKNVSARRLQLSIQLFYEPPLTTINYPITPKCLLTQIPATLPTGLMRRFQKSPSKVAMPATVVDLLQWIRTSRYADNVLRHLLPKADQSQREIASHGGHASGGKFQPGEQRAREAGHKGGHASGGSFKPGDERAKEAGHKGGMSGPAE
jgi:general stress protein YciG